MTATPEAPPTTPQPAPLPPGWAWTTLGEVAYVNARPDTSGLDEDAPVTFIPMAAVQEVCGQYDGSQVRSYGQVKKGYTPFQDGDLIFAKITPCMENGKAALVDGLTSGIGYGSTEFHVIRATSVLERKYAFYLVTSKQFRGEAEHNMRGAAGQKRVPPHFLTDYSLPLPPLPEQRRIVARIEELFSKLDAGTAELKRTQALLKRYRQSLLHAAVTGELSREWRAANPATETGAELLTRILEERRGRWAQSGKKGKYKEPQEPETAGLPELPTEWTWASVEQVADVGTGATPLKGERRFYEGGSIPWVTSGAMNSDFITEPTNFITEAAVQETNAKVFPAGTLLIAMYGEGKTRGKVGELVIPAATNQACAALMFSGPGETRSFAKLFFRWNYDNLRRAAAGGVQPNLSLGIIKEISLPLPPLPEQTYIVSEVERRLSILDNLEATVSAELKRAEAMRQSVLHRAFTGGLVPQDPADEPASVLLERIQAEKLKAGAAAVRAGGRRGRKPGGGGLFAPDAET
ncbi:restriction endonuclease subunit S [Deinococcus sp. MIMF12]|uniref:Restriction endonuclease subunit S n=1 Tax=Deinococcus rhizophilus TaxID=3049544 RepID=A0ABT7JCC6_9DEIO|nr:restriction endonuclease subunit S [Deinococcus rhizophilus]MDL2342703.1 restriction endonuclease subunit S [Deinococcus rhizophilus]